MSNPKSAFAIIGLGTSRAYFENMNKYKPLVIHIYRDMMKQANIFRQQAEKHTGLFREHLEEKSQELFYWCGQLESTEEVNPTKKDPSPEKS